MPKQDTDINARVWDIMQRHCNRGSAAKIKNHEQQLEEIESRLSALSRDFAAIGAAITPTAAQVVLDIDSDTFNRWLNALSSTRDEHGNPVNISLDKAQLEEGEKGYILSRSRTIKKYLEQGEVLAATIAQAKDNKENGGSLWVLQNIYGIGQDKGKEAVTVSLEDLLAVAAKIKERAGQV